MRSFYLAIALLTMTAACLAQQGAGTTQGPDQKGQIMGMSGQKTVTGCIAMGAPSGFILKADDGTTYPLRTDRDLTPFVGKRVQIEASWTRTGITLTEGEAAAAGPETKPGAKAIPGGQTTFGGSIRMQYKGKVLGDCK